MNVERHITVTTFIFDDERTLLILHPRYKKWMAPGGHLEKDEIPHCGAVREAKEETGLDIEIISGEEDFHLHTPYAKSLPRPYLCLLEDVPANSSKSAHQHIDMIYIGRPISFTLGGAHSCRWMGSAEVEKLEDEILPDTLQILRHLFQKRKRS